MTEVEQNILEAAIGVIARYGIRKTTMADIADTAGVSRQTLYTHYRNKDTVLIAAMHFVADKSERSFTERRIQVGTLGEVLDIYFEECVINYFHFIAQTPDAQDLLLGFTPAGKAASIEVSERKARLIADSLAPFEAQIQASGTTVISYARFFTTSASNAKFSVQSLDQLQDYLAALKISVLSTLRVN
ncbi:TetR/AcrR family transcriptional regulator [Algirhabdus cladophorae]|uniref:TetR/AcrR family transcriptional regulator n=1 Tax=Algirhabdus cladophorae TaxID=3377108 RepID=UPI003B847BDD